MSPRSADALTTVYPEVQAGGYSRVDGVVDFFLRVQALLDPSMTVLDYGAGRAEWMTSPETPPVHLKLRNLRGQVNKVIGVDVDPIVAENQSVDEAHTIEMGAPVPLPDASVDLVLADHLLEHIDDPEQFAREMTRLVRPGGWLCARTPNSHGYIAVGARLIPNSRHAKTLNKLQPTRKSMDVFPTRYHLNTPRALRKHFPESEWEHIVYAHNHEPRYFANSVFAWRVGATVFRHMPNAFSSTLHVYLRRR